MVSFLVITAIVIPSDHIVRLDGMAEGARSKLSTLYTYCAISIEITFYSKYNWKNCIDPLSKVKV